MRGGLTVAEAAAALGTSPQTVRALLRKGQLRGEQRPWGSRYVWEVSPEGLEEFLSQYGRLDGRRRSPAPPPAAARGGGRPRDPAPATAVLPPRGGRRAPTPTEDDDLEEQRARRPAPAPAAPRPRHGRRGGARPPAPARLRGGADRPGRPVVRRAGTGGRSSAGWSRRRPSSTPWSPAPSPCSSGSTSLVAGRDTWLVRRRSGVLALVAAALVVASLFASSAAAHWQTYLLWRHRQTFGVVDPVHGKDVGFFVFTLPFEVLVSGLLLWLVAVTAGVRGAGPRRVAGRWALRPLRATFAAQLHLAVLAAAFLLAVAWRLRLEQYLLELQQPGVDGSRSFAGAGYVDVHVRTPGLAVLAVVAVALALRLRRRAVRRAVDRGAPGPAAWSSCRRQSWWRWPSSAMAVVPALVQRFVVDPNQLLSEKPFLERSTVATRHALGLDRIDGRAVHHRAAGSRPPTSASVDRRLAHVADVGHLAARRPDAAAGDRHPLLQPGRADARRRAGRRTAAAHRGECPRARSRRQRRGARRAGATTGSPTRTASG